MNQLMTQQSKVGEVDATRPPPMPRSRIGGSLAWVARILPTLLVLGVLACLGYWGHATGWKLPKVSALRNEDRGAAADWCDAHGVPESECVECRPDLMPKGREYGWCRTHGVSECPLEHPEVAQTSVPPAVTAADLDRAQRALAFDGRLK